MLYIDKGQKPEFSVHDALAKSGFILLEVFKIVDIMSTGYTKTARVSNKMSILMLVGY